MHPRFKLSSRMYALVTITKKHKLNVIENISK